MQSTRSPLPKLEQYFVAMWKDRAICPVIIPNHALATMQRLGAEADEH
jgi:hypothetical protein